MNRFATLSTTTAVSLLLTSMAIGSEAETSASVSGGRRPGSDSAAATARYSGDVGFARTDTQSGRINLARGVAVGVDEDGLSLSVSHAVSTPAGTAHASTFNLSIGRDGRTSTSVGRADSRGLVQSSASAGGRVSTGYGASASAAAEADPAGHARASTSTHTSGQRRVVVIKHKLTREVQRQRIVLCRR
ncbi:MAG: hypothetical protein KKB50_06570 [Planctomycetes bacterium]|nr:hypothetical protein [Planctomycetota bacterium]